MSEIMEIMKVSSNFAKQSSSGLLSSDQTLNPLLREYEAFIKALQTQIEFYKVMLRHFSLVKIMGTITKSFRVNFQTEQQNLRGELQHLVQENSALSEQIKTTLSSEISNQLLKPAIEERENGLISNLQRQLDLISQEKETAMELWKTLMKEVDNLEHDLQYYQSSKHVDVAHQQIEKVKQEYSEAISILDSRLSEVQLQLETERTSRGSLAAELSKVQLENQKSANVLEVKNKELTEALEGQCAALKKTESLEKEATFLTREIEVLTTSREELESALNHCHERTETLMKKHAEAQVKVEEALALIECTVVEKNAAELRENSMKEENIRLHAALKELIDEAGQKVKEERDKMKQQYNDQIKVVLEDMKVLEKTISEKDALLEREVHERKILQKELEKKCTRDDLQKEDPAVTMLQRKINLLYQDLTRLERQNFKLTSERDALKDELAQVNKRHKAEMNQKSTDCQLLEQQLTVLHSDMEALTQEQAETMLNSQRLAVEVQRLERQLTEEHPHQPDSDRSVLMAQMSELQHHLHCQQQVKNKWQETVRSLTDKFEERLRELRAESSSLKKQNKELQKQLKAARYQSAEHE